MINNTIEGAWGRQNNKPSPKQKKIKARTKLKNTCLNLQN
jgi:hypothetical protein